MIKPKASMKISVEQLTIPWNENGIAGSWIYKAHYHTYMTFIILLRPLESIFRVSGERSGMSRAVHERFVFGITACRVSLTGFVVAIRVMYWIWYMSHSSIFLNILLSCQRILKAATNHR